MKQILNKDNYGNVDGDEFILSTGRKINANNGYIGINPEMMLSEGYDGHIYADRWTPEERIELADYMIGLWQEYKLKASNEKGE